MFSCLIGLGSNLGDRHRSLDAALAELENHPAIRVEAVSSWHETVPVGGPAGEGLYLNGAARLQTGLAAEPLLAVLQETETRLGRRRTQQWAARTIDLDLLLYEQQVVQTAQLVVPHPSMAFRRFVLGPAAEVAPEMVHSQIGWTIRQLLESLDSVPLYIAVTGATGVGKTWLTEQLGERFEGQVIRDPAVAARTVAVDPDLPSHVVSEEIRFLGDRARKLEHIAWADAQQLDARGITRPLVVSDFWMEQSLPYACRRMGSNELIQIETEWQTVQQRVIRPQLLILLTAPAAWIQKRLEHCGQSPLPLKQIDQLQAAIVHRATEPDVGPYLRLNATDRREALHEATAAVQAML